MNGPSHLAPAEVTAVAKRNGRLGFAFGPRFFFMLGIGLLWLIPAYFIRRFAYVMLAWDGVLLFFWAVDLARLPKAAALTVSRRWARPLSLDMETTVSITVQTPALGVGAAQVIDAAPPAAVDEVEELPFQLDRLWWSASYRVKPRQRGDLQFGPAYLRYQSKLGLAERWSKADLSQTVRVYPNLQETLQNSIYLLKNRQMETERRLLRLRGQATEFESLREYRLGDDYRAISWTATARRSRLVVRQFQAERSQPIWIVLDCGRLMRTETGRISKLDYAVNAALNVTQVAMYGGDKVGLLAYGRRPRQQMLPGRGALHLHNMIELLSQVHAEPAEADHLRAAATLLSAQRRRALIIWITDLADTAVVPEVISGASSIMPQHVMLFAVIAHPQMTQKAQQQPENKRQLFEIAAAREVMLRRELLLSRLRQQGAYTMEIGPEGLSEFIISKYLEIKERNLI